MFVIVLILRTGNCLLMLFKYRIWQGCNFLAKQTAKKQLFLLLVRLNCMGNEADEEMKG